MTQVYFLVLDKCNTGRASVIFLQAQCRLRYVTVTLSAKGSIFKGGHDNLYFLSYLLDNIVIVYLVTYLFK